MLLHQRLTLLLITRQLQGKPTTPLYAAEKLNLRTTQIEQLIRLAVQTKQITFNLEKYQPMDNIVITHIGPQLAQSLGLDSAHVNQINKGA